LEASGVSAARIVIADDETIPRIGLREMLEHFGYLVVGEAMDGEEAVDLARKLHPDVVVMDIIMPGMIDGISAAKILTAERIAPVVLITAIPDLNSLERLRDAGVFSYVPKPYDANQLVPQIELALARFAEFQALVEEAGSAREAMEARKYIERAKGVLMKAQNLDEAEAYRYIQRRSMDTRRPMREIAEAILLTIQSE
jgi:response regulator NasT